ncbi:MAG: PTS sugar transporter subunit IIA [Gemmatimonadota bacterium]|nr:MAG: PTS sugar transporter subunit IIA [Gemmatimonadota bacterium]
MSDEPVLGVLLAHGAMARGMVDAVIKIAGADESVLVPLSNEGVNPQVMVDRLNELVGDTPAVIFTDLTSGSCTMAAQITCRDNGRRVVVAGVNLPMLLDFVFNRSLPLDELVPRLLERGRTGVRSVPACE